MTPTAVGLVLVEGHDAGGEIMDQDAFDVPTRRGATAISRSDYVAGALSRTRSIADRRRPHAIGVTWSDDSELEASLLLKSLSDAGFDNIVAVRSPEASEALARGIGRAVGYDQTAVCLLEPQSAVLSMVDTDGSAVQVAADDEHLTGRGLIDWLTQVFGRNDWNPECLILVGPDTGLDALASQLERALGMSVFAPPEAELALARGAALASTQSPEFDFGDYLTGVESRRSAPKRSLPLSYTAALSMLVVGVVALVVSISLVAGLHLTSESTTGTTPTVQTQAFTPPAPAAAATPPPAAPAPAPVQVEAVNPPEAVETEAASAPTEVESIPATEPSDGGPEAAPVETAAPVVEAVPPSAVPPPTAAPAAPPVSGRKPPLLTRILGRLRPNQQAPAAGAPETAPPAGAPTDTVAPPP